MKEYPQFDLDKLRSAEACDYVLEELKAYAHEIVRDRRALDNVASFSYCEANMSDWRGKQLRLYINQWIRSLSEELLGVEEDKARVISKRERLLSVAKP